MNNFKYYNPNISDMIDRAGVEQELSKIRKGGKELALGVVRIFENGKIIENLTQNLVVAKGRQYIAQRLFGLAHPSEVEVSPNASIPIWDWKVTHFGVGSGGSVVVGSYVNLLGPEICDEDLYDPIALSGSPGDPSYLTSPGDPAKGVSPTPFVVKPIKPSGTIDIVAATDLNCTIGRTYSYVRVVCSKFPGEPNYLQFDDDYLAINEAALYYSDGVDKVRTFAHICFSPKYIEKKSELVIEWYILC